jgi:release factor glutamine methyltransferase
VTAADPHPSPSLVARLRAAGCVFAEEEAELLIEAAGGDADTLEALVGRRVAGEPLEPLLGWAAFCGLRVRVLPGVFVPRRRTEFLAERAVALASAAEARRSPAVVLDLCCGAGAIGAVVASRVPEAEVWAADIDEEAVRCARLNLPPERVCAGDLFTPLPASLRGRIDVIAVNAPYVPTAEIVRMPVEARLHEPGVALDGGSDGLDLHRRIAAEAADRLAPGGVLLIEASERQAPVSAALFRAAGLEAEVESSEEHDATIVVARRR